jgi:hypothetical protein
MVPVRKRQTRPIGKYNVDIREIRIPRLSILQKPEHLHVNRSSDAQKVRGGPIVVHMQNYFPVPLLTGNHTGDRQLRTDGITNGLRRRDGMLTRNHTSNVSAPRVASCWSRIHRFSVRMVSSSAQTNTKGMEENGYWVRCP